MVTAYRAERHRQENDAHAASIGYATELAEILERAPLITFRSWLEQRRSS